MAYTDKINRVTGVIILHPLTVTFVLLTTSYPIEYAIPTSYWFIILASFILSVIFLLLEQRIREKTLLYGLFLSDIPLIGTIVHYSRGIENMFPLLYVVLVIVSAAFLYRTGVYIISLGAVLCLLAVIVLNMASTVLSINSILQRFYLFALLMLFMAIFSGNLAERYRSRAQEISELKLTTDEIIRNLPTGIVTIDKAGEIVHTNITDAALRGQLHAYLVRFLNTPGFAGARELAINKRLFLLSCARIGSGQGALGMLQDLTAIKRLEESSRISRQTKMLAELSGSLAHEIRNPLASIKGSLEVISQSRDEKIKPFVAVAIKESGRLNDIVTDFLNFAQFLPKKLNRILIDDIVTEALLEASARFPGKKITVVRRNRGFYCRVDPHRFKAAVVNILINAYEASGEGQAITIETAATKREGTIEITDAGGGINRKNIKKIFDPFFTTKKGGTGLGLSIARKIVEAHDGRIEVASVPGKTAFKVFVPRVA